MTTDLQRVAKQAAKEFPEWFKTIEKFPAEDIGAFAHEEIFKWIGKFAAHFAAHSEQGWVSVSPETMPKEGEDLVVREKDGTRSALPAVDFEDMIEFQEGRYTHFIRVSEIAAPIRKSAISELVEAATEVMKPPADFELLEAGYVRLEKALAAYKAALPAPPVQPESAQQIEKGNNG